MILQGNTPNLRIRRVARDHNCPPLKCLPPQRRKRDGILIRRETLWDLITEWISTPRNMAAEPQPKSERKSSGSLISPSHSSSSPASLSVKRSSLLTLPSFNPLLNNLLRKVVSKVFVDYVGTASGYLSGGIYHLTRAFLRSVPTAQCFLMHFSNSRNRASLPLRCTSSIRVPPSPSLDLRILRGALQIITNDLGSVRQRTCHDPTDHGSVP